MADKNLLLFAPKCN